MYTNNQTNNAVLPADSSSSSSQVEDSPSVHQQFCTFNITVNYVNAPNAPPPPPEQALPMISNLIGQQMKDFMKEERRRSRARRRSSRRHSRHFPQPPPPQNPAVSNDELSDDVTQKESVVESVKSARNPETKKTPRYSDESPEIEKKIRYRLVPKRNLKDDELPKKRYSEGGRRRMEHEDLRHLNSLEPVAERHEEQKREKARRRSVLE
ncbi:hypothetical protein GCK72_014965 [Caenorhabditis remanei]|uniref:Uncharacterized protein n=1 Tax=Caenorhabditis remanei TaxID=31234 RepID=A0A6A5GTH7_CAERE|nr:hypothetical protein GCK72_014965 [Caenorhabditis remanei]KAF1758507.1 hypothetical protein GCK72_014965 [Caenorhabditis remanei]